MVIIVCFSFFIRTEEKRSSADIHTSIPFQYSLHSAVAFHFEERERAEPSISISIIHTADRSDKYNIESDID